MSARGSSVKRFERSNGLDTALYKCTPLHVFASRIRHAAYFKTCKGILYVSHDLVLRNQNFMCIVNGGDTTTLSNAVMVVKSPNMSRMTSGN